MSDRNPTIPFHDQDRLASDLSVRERDHIPETVWMQSGVLHRLFGGSRTFRKIAMGGVCALEFALLKGHKSRETLALIRNVRRERESLMGANEAFLLHSLASAQSRLGGEMAEVGVYQGCSAKIITLASREVPLHLFDTFAGLPEPGPAERNRLWKGEYSAHLGGVQEFLSQHPNVNLHPGMFPGTAAGCENLLFSFVHLDVDLASSMRAALEFFYPRMVQGGIILTHDYSWLDGVRGACDAFLERRPEMMIELPTSQAMLVKC